MKNSPRGFTLIELLLAMILFSTILTVVAVALGGLARADRKSRDRIDRERNVQRFVMRLRQDVHEAGACTISPVKVSSPDDITDAAPSTPKQSLVLVRTDGRIIHFDATDDGIVRTVTRDDTEQHRESYAWGSPASVQWDMDTTQELPMAILTLTIEGGSERPAERLVVRTTLLSFQSNTEE